MVIKCMNDFRFDVIIIGGGITGAGIARDMSLRGIEVLLLEKSDLAEGTTGRCHAMVHSGGRYCVSDPEAASECAVESKIIFDIAPHISEPCGGYFMGVSDEDCAYGDRFTKSCKNAEVAVEEISPKLFLKSEPNCNPNARKVYRVHDGYVDPFLLTIYNAFDATEHGAEVKTYCEVEELLIDDEKTVYGVRYVDKTTNTRHEATADLVINATGPWAARLERDLDLEHNLQIQPTAGTILVVKDRLVNSLINRLRLPGDADIIVPSHQSILVGTTSYPAEVSELDSLLPSRREIEKIYNSASYIIPTLKNHRLIRFYAGARPLIAQSGSLRTSSRQFEIIDYEKTSEYAGLITIFGGKLTTYRLMAEKLTDLVCQKLGHKCKCITRSKHLPGGDGPVTMEDFRRDLHVDEKTAFDMQYKWGTFYREFEDICSTCIESYRIQNEPRTICECENVTELELSWCNNVLGVRHLDDYRRRTRQGMGICQGLFCYYKLADLDIQWSGKSHSLVLQEMKTALEKRWKTEENGDPQLRRQIKLAKYMYLMGGNL